MMSDTSTTIELPLTRGVAEQLQRLLHKAVELGYGQIEITINPRGIKIIDHTEYRFEWK